MLYLWEDGGYPYDNKNDIPLKTLENISLTVNLSCIYFIEKCHHDECIKNSCEMLGRLGGTTFGQWSSIIHVQQTFSYTKKNSNSSLLF